MTFDTAILLAQTGCVFFITGWLTTGAFENLIHPKLNSTLTAEVLDMVRMREEFPEAYSDVAYRRVANPAVQNALFWLIVAWEMVATALLWVGLGALLLALFGSVEPASARTLAVLGTLAFTSVWAGFLIGGNWFCYWFAHDDTQKTHYHMTLWGLGTLILLTAA